MSIVGYLYQDRNSDQVEIIKKNMSIIEEVIEEILNKPISYTNNGFDFSLNDPSDGIRKIAWEIFFCRDQHFYLLSNGEVICIKLDESEEIYAQTIDISIYARHLAIINGIIKLAQRKFGIEPKDDWLEIFEQTD